MLSTEQAASTASNREYEAERMERNRRLWQRRTSRWDAFKAWKVEKLAELGAQMDALGLVRGSAERQAHLNKAFETARRAYNRGERG